MRLLDKNEVNRRKNLEKRVEIDEGLKLARKVDSLRKTSLEEESKLGKFRDSTTKIVQKEIDGLIDRRNILADEVEILETKKREEFTLKFGIELDKIKAKEKLLNDKFYQLLENEDTLKAKDIQLQISQENMAVERRTLADNKIRADDNLRITEDSKKKASEILEEAEDEAELIKGEIAKKIKNLNIREEVIASQERDNRIKIEYIAEKELEFIDRERVLKDRYATLERTLKRLK